MKEPLKNVCERYGINFSSAKNVIQIYKKEGRLEKKIVKERKIVQGQRTSAIKERTGSMVGERETRDGFESGPVLDEEEDDEFNVETDEFGNKVPTIAPFS